MCLLFTFKIITQFINQQIMKELQEMMLRAEKELAELKSLIQEAKELITPFNEEIKLC